MRSIPTNEIRTDAHSTLLAPIQQKARGRRPDLISLLTPMATRTSTLLIVLAISIPAETASATPFQRQEDRGDTSVNTSVCSAGRVLLSPQGRFVSLQSVAGRNGPFASGIFGDPVDVVEWPDASGAGRMWRLSEQAGAVSFMSATQIAVGVPARGEPVPYRLSADGSRWEPIPRDTLLRGLTPLANFWTAQFIPAGTPGTQLDALSTEAITDRSRLARSHAFRANIEGDGIRNLTRTFDGVFILGGSFGRPMEVMKLDPTPQVLGSLPDEINRTGFPGLSFARTSDNDTVVYDSGVFLRHAVDRFVSIPVPIYSEPVLAADGTVIGHYNPEGLTGNSAHRHVRAVGPMINRLVDRGWTIRSLSADPASGRVAILISGGTPSDRALILRSPHRTSVIRCVPDGTPAPVGDRVGYQTERLDPARLLPVHAIRLRQIGPAGERIAVWSTLPHRRPVGHVLVIRGGPQATVRQADLNSIEQALLGQGYAIHRFDYAGTISSTPELFSRLRRGLAEAVGTDARSIAGFMAGLSRAGRTILLADSFGTVLAAQVHREASSRIDMTVLIAPMARWSPFLSPLSGPEGQVQTVLVRRQHHEAYGAPVPNGDNAADVQAFSDRIDNLLRPLCDVTAIHVFVGKYDLTTPPTDWEHGCLSRLPRTVVDDAGHALSPGMETGVLAILSGTR